MTRGCLRPVSSMKSWSPNGPMATHPTDENFTSQSTVSGSLAPFQSTSQNDHTAAPAVRPAAIQLARCVPSRPSTAIVSMAEATQAVSGSSR